MSEKVNVGGLIIDPALLADIQRQCRQRAAELEAARIQGSDSAESVPQAVLAMPAPMTEAEHFSAAIQEMLGNVRRFFEHEEPVPAWRRESEEERSERARITALGGWAANRRGRIQAFASSLKALRYT